MAKDETFTLNWSFGFHKINMEVQIQLDKWASTLQICGLKISQHKSEVLVFGRDRSMEMDIVLSGELLKLVNNFRYLGSVIGRINDEV